ncbi:MAG TPA: GNAT family N-acetyltransferase [Acidobacteriaceae bacterium]|nr:GNAT family N-acetyltransferase [Acidobacteriaceae bacterium]
MSSSPVASQIEILDLRHFSARQLRPLLEREAEVWRDRLRWDYRSSTELLLQYLESRILHGFVALDQGRVCGYTFCVYEGHKAVIGDAFATGHRSISDAAATQVLLVHALEMLQNSPTVDRVESQLLLFESGEFSELFKAPGYTIYPRLFLECNVRDGYSRQRAVRELSPDLEITPWAAQDYERAGELIYACYAGHTDAKINDQYRTMHGSLRFLHNIVRFPGCGVFEPQFSWMLWDGRTGTLVGMVLCSRVAANVAHVTQLCILPSYRGQGLGRILLARSADALLEAGFEAMTLTVTEANRQAVKLYESFGFSLRHRFDAMALDTRSARS